MKLSLPLSPRSTTLALIALAAAEVALIAVIRLTAAAPDGGDLCRDYLDAHRLLAGQDPYAPFAGCGALHHSPHPPLGLLVLVPLALLPVGAAAAIWDLLMLAALTLALWLIWDELRPSIPPIWLLVGLAALGIWPPILDTWLEAQIGPLILLLIVLAWRARRRGEPWAAGAWLAVATLLRLYPVLLFIVPLVRRDWRMLAGGAITGVAVTALSLPFIGIGGYVAYFTREAPGSTAEWINDAHNVSLRGWLGDLFVGNNTLAPIAPAPALVTPLWLIGVLAVVALVAANVWRARSAPVGSPDDEQAWHLVVPAMLLLSPLAWPHYFDILILPLAAAGTAWWNAQRWTAPAVALAVGFALLWANSLGLAALFPLPRVLPWPAGLLVFALPFYALVLIFAAMRRWPALDRTNG
jgi:hypothetical protein